jgi:MinD superfamily P-loop ATPase
MKELVIISGKGGTGKTSVTAGLASLTGGAVLADCDVDAADLHLVLQPEIQRHEEFRSGHEAVIRQEDCIGCGACKMHCHFEAVRMSGRRAGIDAVFTIDPHACEGCGVCVRFCPVKAIDFPERVCGEWYASRTRYGTMIHARLGASGENSGRLVSLVREEARLAADRNGADWLLVDGPPGIGCPVIASVTGASAVLIVTEPSLSGEHDLERVLGLARGFSLPAMVAVNKWDIQPEMTDRIERFAREAGAVVAGRIPYDAAVTRAQVEAKTLFEIEEGPAAKAIRALWQTVQATMLPERTGDGV